ncbi:hypothetical protein ORI89_09670 [Sphingobacterium sp. UT-1RO-CII-1]|uniref:HU domain-containing protein n=1 Tax=Sphingobacterium sp. UT-1RO-CII-1 TaxID=2995225 RepID=UPI00227A560C|nr:hypothetical protein [Sphingobacterium sp. UT-1RO-CII-1]MCY4779919.1 hypothetical protein [Sphingobacterium sp. UT-1RO-CII-1]
MNLGKNVFNLLKRQERVVVVGLGVFQKNHTPASYDEDKKVYLPPITYIEFDPSGAEGYDFVQYIQQLESLDYSAALTYVEGAVKEVIQRVTEDGQVKLDDLGYLLSFGGGYVFKPLDLSGFNLEPIPGPAPVTVEGTIEEIEKTELKEELVEEVKPTIVEENKETLSTVDVDQIKEDQALVVPQTPIFAPDNIAFDDFEEEPKRNNKIWYIVLALVAVGILAALYFINDDKNILEPPPLVPVVIDTTEETVDTAGIVEAQLDSLLAVDSLNTVAVDQDSVQVEEKDVLVPADHRWQIVIGSHKTLEQAYEQASTYNKQGYDKVRVIPSNMAKNRKKVIWDSYRTKEEADSALIYVQKNIIKDAWPDKIK